MGLKIVFQFQSFRDWNRMKTTWGSSWNCDEIIQHVFNVNNVTSGQGNLTIQRSIAQLPNREWCLVYSTPFFKKMRQGRFGFIEIFDWTYKSFDCERMCDIERRVFITCHNFYGAIDVHYRIIHFLHTHARKKNFVCKTRAYVYLLFCNLFANIYTKLCIIVYYAVELLVVDAIYILEVVHVFVLSTKRPTSYIVV